MDNEQDLAETGMCLQRFMFEMEITAPREAFLSLIKQAKLRAMKGRLTTLQVHLSTLTAPWAIGTAGSGP
jgi:hypothetical protein